MHLYAVVKINEVGNKSIINNFMENNIHNMWDVTEAGDSGMPDKPGSVGLWGAMEEEAAAEVMAIDDIPRWRKPLHLILWDLLDCDYVSQYSWSTIDTGEHLGSSFPWLEIPVWHCNLFHQQKTW